MNDLDHIHAQIGEVKIGREGQTLHALLGSCVGVGFLWPKRHIFGLGHCLLSKSAQVTEELGGRHVDQAIWSLMRLMDISKEERRQVHVILVGGGNMTMADNTPDARLVGSINATFAKKAVKLEGLRLIHDDLGGNHARKVSIDCTTGQFTVKQIQRLGVA